MYFYKRELFIKLLRAMLSGYLIYAAIFLLPLLPANFEFGYELIKVLFLYLAVLAICAFYLVTDESKEAKSKLNHQVLFASFVFLSVLLLTSITGVDINRSLIGGYPYFQGFFLYFFLFSFSVLVAVIKISLKKLALFITLSGIIVSVIALKDYLLLNLSYAYIPTYAGRVVSTFGQPNFYSGFLVFVLPFFFALQTKKRYLYFVLLIFSGAVIASFSESAIFLLLLYLLWKLLQVFRFDKRLFLGLLGVVFAFCLVLAALFNAPSIFYNELIQPLTDENPDLQTASLEKRVYIWPVVLQFVQQRPVLGYGLENLPQIFSTYQPPEDLRGTSLFGVKALVVDRSHNLFLDLLFYSGLLGLTAWCYLFITIYTKAENTMIKELLILYLVWVQFQNQSVVHLLFFYLAIGLVMKKSLKNDR